MRVALDATPLLGRRTGIGRYVAALLDALAEQASDELVAVAFTTRGQRALRAAVPAGVTAAGRPVPARLLRRLWSQGSWPPVELLSGRADVVHGTNFVLPPARRAAGVVTVHDLAYLHHPHTVSAESLAYRELVPVGLRRAAAVITVSAAVAAQVRAAYSPRCPVHVIPHGVAPQWFEPPGPPPAGLPEQYVLFVGTLEPRKGLPTLLAAHRLLPDAPPLVLAGGAGWGEVPSTDGVMALGYVEEPRLRALVAGASAVVLPSLDEGFGLPVLEALAAGTPVVASDLPALREVGAGFASYAPVGDAEALAEALRGVLAGPPDPEPGRRHAAGFTWARCAELTRAVYAEASSSRS